MIPGWPRSFVATLWRGAGSWTWLTPWRASGPPGGVGRADHNPVTEMRQTVAMILLRMQMPETPGTLGLVATAVGATGGNIQSLEIIEHGDDWVIDDFMIDLPPAVLPDTVVAACQSIADVRVLWVSRHHAPWRVEQDTAVLNRMSEEPERAAQILAEAAPGAFHSTWAALLDRSSDPARVIAATDLAPDFAADGVAALGDLGTVRTFDLPPEWLPQWGETIIALAPLGRDRTIVVGRQGGPAYLSYELTRLKHLAALAG